MKHVVLNLHRIIEIANTNYTVVHVDAYARAHTRLSVFCLQLRKIDTIATLRDNTVHDLVKT